MSADPDATGRVVSPKQWEPITSVQNRCERLNVTVRDYRTRAVLSEVGFPVKVGRAYCAVTTRARQVVSRPDDRLRALSEGPGRTSRSDRRIRRVRRPRHHSREDVPRPRYTRLIPRIRSRRPASGRTEELCTYCVRYEKTDGLVL